MGVSPRTVERSIYDALIGRHSLSEVMQPTELESLMLIPSKQDLVAAEVELVDDRDRAFKLRDTLQELLREQPFEYVFIDCPPSLGILTVNALSAADRVLVPLQCEYYALEGLTSLMATVDRVRGGMNARLELEGIVLTMFDPRNNLAHQVADEVKKHFHVFESVIPRNVRLSEAPSHGKPVLLYDVQSKGAQGYLSLAREILASGRRFRRKRLEPRDDFGRLEGRAETTRPRARPRRAPSVSVPPRTRTRASSPARSRRSSPSRASRVSTSTPTSSRSWRRASGSTASSSRSSSGDSPGATSSSSSPASGGGGRSSARACARPSSSSRT